MKRNLSMRRSGGLCSASLAMIRKAARDLYWETQVDGPSLSVVTPDAWFHFGSDRTVLVCRAWVREGGNRSSAVRQREQLSKAVQSLRGRSR